MKKTPNNLEPNAQQWVRGVESAIDTLERSSSSLTEADRRNNVVVGGLTNALAEIRAQQQQIIANQERLDQQQVIKYATFSRTSSGPIPLETVNFGSVDIPAWATSCQVLMLQNATATLVNGSFTAGVSVFLRDNLGELITFSDTGYGAISSTIYISPTQYAIEPRFASASGLVDLSGISGPLQLTYVSSVTGTSAVGSTTGIGSTITVFLIFR